MKKQGIEMATSTLILLIILGVFLIFAITYVIKSGENIEGITSKYIESLEADYDEDGIRDYYDKSPCVAGQDTIVAEEDGKQYYYFADAKKNPDAKNEEEEYICTDFPRNYYITTYGDESLVRKTDDASNKQVCVLASKVCVQELERQYLDMRCMDGQSKACTRLAAIEKKILEDQCKRKVEGTCEELEKQA